MQFGPWQPLGEAAAVAPAMPGVLQARSEALRNFPRGKSAMILYAASATGEPLRDFVRGRGATALQRAAALDACWVRFGETPTPEPALARLLDQFSERFGGPPPANS